MNYYYVGSDRTKVLNINNQNIRESFPRDAFSVTVSNESVKLDLPETIASVEQKVMNAEF